MCIRDRLKGNWGERNSFTEEIDKWVESASTIPSAELVADSEKAIKRILAEDSELKELWDEDGINEKWHQEMNALLTRITS